MKQVGFLLLFYFAFQNVRAQQTQLEVQFLYDGKAIELGNHYNYLPLNDSVSFDALKCYLSQITLIDTKNKRISLAKKHFLVDIENPQSCVIKLPNALQIASLQLTVGVDSTSNAQAIMTGDLDPINGMYWAWQSGFINWKIQGKCTVLQTRNHVFQYHIGGFLPPFQSTRTILLENSNPTKNVKLMIDLSAFLNQVNLLETNEIMSPCQKGTELADLFSSYFSLANE